MGDGAVIRVKRVIDFIEEHLDGKLELETVAEGVHYSKYHLHRVFLETVGMTVHDYVQRRQMTEAARLLVFSDRPVAEIALACGYESRQAFSLAFKEMYKLPPAQYRARGNFYPLQLRFFLHRELGKAEFTKEAVRLAGPGDIPAWMELMRLAIDGYPAMDEAEYLEKLEESVAEKRALVLENQGVLVGALIFSPEPGNIEFLGVHPQYRNRGIWELFLEVLMEKYLPGREISMTTYRERDRADTGYRERLLELGFERRELLTEFGYPTQRFVRPAKGERQEERK